MHLVSTPSYLSSFLFHLVATYLVLQFCTLCLMNRFITYRQRIELSINEILMLSTFSVICKVEEEFNIVIKTL